MQAAVKWMAVRNHTSFTKSMLDFWLEPISNMSRGTQKPNCNLRYFPYSSKKNGFFDETYFDEKGFLSRKWPRGQVDDVQF